MPDLFKLCVLNSDVYAFVCFSKKIVGLTPEVSKRSFKFLVSTGSQSILLGLFLKFKFKHPEIKIFNLMYSK